MSYLDAMRDEAWLLAGKNKKVVGVLSYLVGHVEPVLEGYAPSLYVTTIAVSGSCRGSGLATALYNALYAQARQSDVRWITTRTWSTNVGHMRLLYGQGYTEVARQVRDSFVDSVYLARPVALGRPV